MIPYPSLTLVPTGKTKSWLYDSAEGPFWDYSFRASPGRWGPRKKYLIDFFEVWRQGLTTYFMKKLFLFFQKKKKSLFSKKSHNIE